MKRFLTHLFFWIIIFIWTSVIHDYSETYAWEFIQFNLLRLPVIIGATYLVLYYFLPKYLIKEKHYVKFLSFFILNFIITTLVDRFIIGLPIVANTLAETGLNYTFFNQIPLLRNAFFLLSIMGIASGIRFFKLYLKEERRKHQLEQENLNTKLSFLKAQVNPHFLFNALNNLYSMAIEDEQEEIAMGLEHLSGIMHYLTYESSSDQVPLDKEIKLLQDYIDIQQLRIEETDEVLIAFNIEGNPIGKQIAPVILLPLLENAFKHGIKPDTKCMVKIHLYIHQMEVIFSIKNTFFPKKKTSISSKGIGIENVKKRLTLLYPENHIFSTKQENSFFITTLQLDLK